jgi:hypothetical protein
VPIGATVVSVILTHSSGEIPLVGLEKVFSFDSLFFSFKLFIIMDHPWSVGLGGLYLPCIVIFETVLQVGSTPFVESPILKASQDISVKHD